MSSELDNQTPPSHSERIVVLDGYVQNYAWGSTSLLPEFLGREPDDRPQAELWLGAHPVLPSRLRGVSLDQAIADHPHEYLGPNAPTDADSLPFLLKVMAVETPLSIQVHPSKSQAEAGFRAEEAAGISRHASNRNFRDANHKPEIICALTEFSLLCGFAGDGETRVRLRVIRDAASLDAQKTLDTIPLPDGTPNRRREMLRAILSTSHLDMPEVTDAIRNVAPDLRLGHLGAIADHYPTDPGVLVAALMNHRVLQPEEAMFFAAGTTHAYLHGLGIELLANSDNVVRAGLTPKHIDIGELLRICNPEPSSAELVSPVRIGEVATWATACTDFELSQVNPGPTAPSVVGVDAGPRIVLCTSGSVTLGAAPGTSLSVTLSRGMAAWVFPNVDLRVWRKTASTESSVYVARCPQLNG